MKLKLITPPSVEPVTLDEAKNFLKIDGALEDNLISALITAARQRVEEYLGKSLITQTWDVYFDSVSDRVKLPRPPVQSIEGVYVMDDTGNETIVDSADYLVRNNEILTIAGWPSYSSFQGFRVRFIAGYGPTTDDVPQAVKKAIMLLIGNMYENRDGWWTESAKLGASQEFPPIVKTLLDPYREVRL